MRDLLSISSLFCNKFNKLNNTGALMPDYIDHMILIFLKHHIFGVETSRFCLLLRNIIMDVVT